MQYDVPVLTLVGSANGVVLGGQSKHIEPGTQNVPLDNLAALEAEW